MTKIALFGAGGKMGMRLSKNLLSSPYQVRHVEPGAVGRQRKENGAVSTADVGNPAHGALSSGVDDRS